MKILFLIPPALDNAPPAERIFGCNYGIYAQPNIFILYPATILKNKGYDVSCIDFTVGNKNMDFNKFCKENDFDIVIFYSVFLSKKTDLIARDMLHKSNSNQKFIFMATEPTASPDDFLDKDTIVIRGEPESRIAKIVEVLENKRGMGHLQDIPGISFLKEGKNIHQPGYEVIEDLDELPFPDRRLFNYREYYNPKLSLQPFTTIVASRGCSFNCNFCVPNSMDFSREIEFKRQNKMSKPPVRLRSPQNIIAECSMLKQAGYKSISFLDDQFVWGEKRTIEICQGIAPLKLEWSCLARADMLQDKAVVEAMASAGCKVVAMGIESFNQEIIDYVNKGCLVDKFYSAIKNLKKAGIEVELNILIGSSPLETKETIQKTFQEVIKLEPSYALFSVCTPFPYTKFNEKAKKEGWMVKPEYEAIDPIKESFISYPHLTKSDLEEAIRQMYLRYYFRPGYILKKICRFKNIKELSNKIKAARIILKYFVYKK